MSLIGTKHLLPVLDAASGGPLLIKWDLSCLADSYVEGWAGAVLERCTAPYL